MRRVPARAAPPFVPTPSRRRRTAAGACASLALALGAAQAQVPYVPPTPIESPAATQTEAQLSRRQTQTQQRPLTFIPTISVEETFTDNVNLQPSATRRSDFITQITPGVTFNGRGARTAVEGSVALLAAWYARTGGENNRIVPRVNMLGTVEAVERLFFIEGSALVSQEYLTPFGQRPVSIVNQTNNEYRTQLYRVSPYFKGDPTADLHYEVRDNNIWSNLSGAPISTNNSYTNEVVANLTRDPLPLGWALEYNRSDIKFQGQDSEQTELARARGIYRPDPAWEVSAGVGYEVNRFPLAHFNDFIYSVGGRWRPTERTALDAFWEHRFFGSSYRFAFDHRMPLTAWSVSASRNITSYPQLLAQLSSGAIVPLLLDAVFSSRIPDPAQRAAFVRQFMQDRGLPIVLTSPLNLYNQQMYLEERETATIGFLGARNTVFLNAFRLRTQPITGTGVILPPAFDLLNNNTQAGSGVVWTYSITGTSTFTTAADYLHTTANEPLTGTSNQASLRLIWSTSITPNTTVYAGARYQAFRSDFSDSTRELAGYAGVTHTFR